MNSSSHPGGCHQFSFHKERSSNTFRTSEAKTASSETIHVMILVVEIQYQVGILPVEKKKIFKWTPSSATSHLFVSDMDGSICDT